MRSALRTFGRVLARHGIALMAWFFGGEAAHQALIVLAGVVGGATTLGGLLLLPLAVAARLVSYIAMFLTVRSALTHVADDHPDTRRARAFFSALLAAILPFFAFYAALACRPPIRRSSSRSPAASPSRMPGTTVRGSATGAG